MKHEEIKDLLPLYVDGGLNIEEMRKVEEHLETCKQCREKVEEYQHNLELFLSMGEEKVPESFLADVMDKVDGIKVNKDVKKKETESWLDRITNLLKVKVQMPAGALLGMMTAAVLLLILVFPFSFSNNGTQLPGNIRQQSLEPQIYKSETYDLADSRTGINQTVEPTVDLERKIIKNADLNIEIKELDQLDQTITDLVQRYKGYIANSGKWITSSKREHARFSLRIPVDNFYQILASIEEMGLVVSSNISGRDVTEEYIDLESRLKNLRLQEERYRELLNQADKVEDILKIEKELERVRSTSESLLGRKQYLDNQVAFSTINIDFVGPEPLTTPTYNLGKVFRQFLRAMTESFYNLLVRLGSFIPYLALLALVYIFYRIYRRKNSK